MEMVQSDFSLMSRVTMNIDKSDRCIVKHIMDI